MTRGPGYGNPRRVPPIDPTWPARWRTALSDAPSRERLEGLLSAPDSQALVRALPAQDLYLLVREIGLSECSGLVARCSGEQLQAFVDLDAWRGDRMDEAVLADWVRSLVQGGCRDVPEVWNTLDQPLRMLALKRLIYVQEIEENEEAPEPFGAFVMDTPDRCFRVSARDEDQVDVARALLATQMAVEPAWVSQLVADADAIFGPEAEELAFRFRCGRLADLGFLDPEEAAVLETPFRTLEEARQAMGLRAVVEAETELPRWMQVRAGEGLLANALAAIVGEPARARVGCDLVLLCNAALVGRGVDLGDPDAVRGEVARVHDTVSLGLRVLGASEPVAAAGLLARSAARTVYRTAVTALHRPRQRAAALLRHGTRLGADAEGFLEALAARPARQADGSAFADTAQVEAAESRLAELEWAAGWLAGVPEDVDALTAFGTRLVRGALGLPDEPEPIPAGAFRKFLVLHVAGGALDPRCVEAALARAGSPPAQRQALAWCEALEEEWGGLDPGVPLVPRWIGGVRLD